MRESHAQSVRVGMSVQTVERCCQQSCNSSLLTCTCNYCTFSHLYRLLVQVDHLLNTSETKQKFMVVILKGSLQTISGVSTTLLPNSLSRTQTCSYQNRSFWKRPERSLMNPVMTTRREGLAQNSCHLVNLMN